MHGKTPPFCQARPGTDAERQVKAGAPARFGPPGSDPGEHPAMATISPLTSSCEGVAERVVFRERVADGMADRAVSSVHALRDGRYSSLEVISRSFPDGMLTDIPDRNKMADHGRPTCRFYSCRA